MITMRNSNVNNQKNILLLENRNMVSTSYAEQIKHCGYRVVTAFAGVNIIETIKNRLSEIDLIVVDTDLALDQLGEKPVLDILKYFEMPVLFLSNKYQSKHDQVYDQESPYSVMSKPSSVSSLNDTIQKVLDVYQSHEELSAISDRDCSSEQMRSESHYREIFESAKEGILIIDAVTGLVMDANLSMARLTGLQKGEITGKTLHQIEFFKKLDVEETIKNEILTQKSTVYNNRAAELPNGEKIHVTIEGRAYRVRGKPMIRCAVRQVAESMATVQQMESELKKKEVMIHELQHRTKNTFAMITGLVELKSFSAESDEAQHSLKELALRVQSISELYQLLYENDSHNTVNMAHYCSVISESIIGTTRNISIRQNFDEVKMDTKKATSLGLILVELLYNVMKYAFPEKKPDAEVEVHLTQKEAGLLLRVSDNGVGLPRKFKVKESHSSGLHLVQILADQLNGKVSITSREGTTVEVDISV